MNKKQQPQQRNKGFALLLSLIISSIALSIGLSMLHITLKQLTLGTTTLGSEIAFQAANSGMECLRYMRNIESHAFVAGDDPIALACLGSTDDFTRTIITPGILFQYQKSDLNWSTPDGNLCIDIELYVVDASSGVQTYTFPDSTKTCSAGDVCTFGFVRGYNRSCGEIATSIFTVQRELTVEF